MAMMTREYDLLDFEFLACLDSEMRGLNMLRRAVRIAYDVGDMCTSVHIAEMELALRLIWGLAADKMLEHVPGFEDQQRCRDSNAVKMAAAIKRGLDLAQIYNARGCDVLRIAKNAKHAPLSTPPEPIA